MSELATFRNNAKKIFDFTMEDLEQVTTIPAGFYDSCWHNDASPRLTSKTLELDDDMITVDIWVAEKDPAMRECDCGKQFEIIIDFGGMMYGYPSDSWEDICKHAPMAIDLLMNVHKEAVNDGATEYTKYFDVFKDKAEKYGFWAN